MNPFQKISRKIEEWLSFANLGVTSLFSLASYFSVSWGGMSLSGAMVSLKGQMLLLPGQMLIDKSSLSRKSQNSSAQLPEPLWSACPYSSAAPTRRTRAPSSSKPFLGRQGWKTGLCDLLDTCLHGGPCSPTDFMTSTDFQVLYI